MLLFTDGMDHLDTTIILWTYYTQTVYSGFTVSASYGRLGGAGYLINNGTTSPWSFSKVVPPTTEIIVGTAIKNTIATPSSSSVEIVRVGNVMSGSVAMASVRWVGSDSTIRIYRGATTAADGVLLASASVSFSWNGYPLFETKIVSGPTGSVEVRLNGGLIPIISASNLNLSGSVSGTNYMNIVQLWGSTGSAQLAVDDVWVMDTSGSGFNTFLGDTRIRTTQPSKSGSFSDMTPSGSTTNFGAVSESISNSDTTFVVAGPTGLPKTDTYQVAAMSSSLKVLGLAGLVHARQDNAGITDVRQVLNVGGTVVVASESVDLGQGYAYSLKPWPTDPTTGLQWAAQVVNAIEFGTRRIS